MPQTERSIYICIIITMIMLKLVMMMFIDDSANDAHDDNDYDVQGDNDSDDGDCDDVDDLVFWTVVVNLHVFTCIHK